MDYMISEAQEEQAALYALDLLSAEEVVAFERELSASAELRALVRELRESGAALAHVAEAQTPPPALKARVLQQIAAEAARGAAPPENVIRPPASVFGRWLPWAIAAGLMIACGLLARERGQLQDRVAQQELATDAARQRAVRAEEAAELARAESQRMAQEARQIIAAAQTRTPPVLVALGATKDGPAQAQAVVAWDAARQSGTIRINNLPSAGTGRDYQLWAVDAEHKEPISAGIVRVDADGTTVVEFKPTAPANQVQAFAISVEREGGASKREGPIVLLGTA
jgi:anti-sigma-K factor RskA